MRAKTIVDWTHWPGRIGATWNPWRGCNKVSAECLHCYIARNRWIKDPWTLTKQTSVFFKPRSWRQPHCIFTCSISDFFHEGADEWRPEAWEIIRETPRHDYLVLTKRPKRIPGCLPEGWPEDFSHVWLGVSIGVNSSMWRLEELLKMPKAAGFFCSAEPLLEALEFRYLLKNLDWLILGGESGRRRRETKTAWFKKAINDARAVGVPVWLKQLGGLWPGGEALLDGREYKELPLGVTG